MGLFASCTTTNEDVGAEKLTQQAVGATSNEITDDQLDGLNLGSGLSQKLILTFSCKDLPNLDVGSKTDPFCVLWELKRNQRVKVGMTECILDNLNPEFVTNIQADYKFEENQNFIIEVYDADNMDRLANLREQELVGSAKFTLHQVITKANQEITMKLENAVAKGNRGNITLKAEEKRQDYGQTECQFELTVTDAGRYGAYPLFMMLHKTNQNGSTQPVYKSENQKQWQNKFSFKRVFSDTDRLANSIDESTIYVKIFKFEKSGSHKCIMTEKVNL